MQFKYPIIKFSNSVGERKGKVYLISKFTATMKVAIFLSGDNTLYCWINGGTVITTLPSRGMICPSPFKILQDAWNTPTDIIYLSNGFR